MEVYAFQNALADVFEVIDNANKYIDATAPWVLAKSEDSKPRLARVLYNLAETLRICTVLLQPFMPTTCEKIFAQLNVEADGKTWDSAAAFGTLPANATLHKGENIFPASTPPRSWPSWRLWRLPRRPLPRLPTPLPRRRGKARRERRGVRGTHR